MVTIVFGDSIGWGAFDKGGGWVERLKCIGFDTQDFLYNCCISGNTSGDVSGRIADEMSVRLDKEDDLRIIIAIGINDASRINKALRVEKKQFIQNIGDIIGQAKLYTEDIWFVGLTTVDESKTLPVYWDPLLTYQNKDIYEYDRLLEEEVKKRLGKDRYIETPLDISLCATDGVHLNTFGHFKILNEVLKSLPKP